MTLRPPRLRPLVAALLCLAATATPAWAAYEVRFEGPAELRELAQRYSDLARFQSLDDVSATELDRLTAAAPAQLGKLFATEGYFNPVIHIDREDSGGGDGSLPRIRVRIEAGPRTTVHTLELQAEGPLADSTLDPDSAARQQALRAQWLLNPGQPFRQSIWEGEKQKLLIQLWTDRYPAARINDSEARIDADENRAALRVQYDSGPLFRFGELQVQGLDVYPRSVIDNLNTIRPGDPYTQKDLLDLQERLLQSGLFDAAAARIEPDPELAEAVPIELQLRERARQNLTLGLGYSTHAGPRATVEHSHQRLFGRDWQARSKLSIAREERSASVELLSYPLPNFYRNLLGANLSRADAGGMVIHQQQLRVGRRHDSDRIRRLYYLSLLRDRTDTAEPLSGNAVLANYEWRYLDVDSPIFPTRGYAVTLQGGGGLRFGEVNSGQPFARVNGRLSAYYPFSNGQWIVHGRAEIGQVFARRPEGIPQTLLYRIGGIDSVRGYRYQSIGLPGPDHGDGPEYIAGGRFMMLGGVEVMRELVPTWYGAAFVDVGDASSRLTHWNAHLGYGVGVRWRSPVGPMKFDVSYGQKTRKFRLDISVGISF